jgi:hypothetical protein
VSTALKPISSIGSHRLAWSIATGLPLEHRYIDALQGLIRLLIQNNGVVALTHASGAHQLGVTHQQFRDLTTWAMKTSWITVLHEQSNIGKVYGLGSTWHQVDWADVEQLAKAEHNRTQPKVKRELIQAAIAIRDGKEVWSPDQTNRVKPIAAQQVSTPNTPTDTPQSKYSKENSPAEVEPQASALSGYGPAEIPAEQPEQPETEIRVEESQEQLTVEPFISMNDLPIEAGTMVEVYGEIGVVTGFDESERTVEYWQFPRLPHDLTVDQYFSWVHSHLEQQSGSSESAYSNLVSVLPPVWQLFIGTPQPHSLDGSASPAAEQSIVTC